MVRTANTASSSIVFRNQSHSEPRSVIAEHGPRRGRQSSDWRSRGWEEAAMAMGGAMCLLLLRASGLRPRTPNRVPYQILMRKTKSKVDRQRQLPKNRASTRKSDPLTSTSL